MPLYRRMQWGALATFHVLDTRQYRSDQIAPVHPAQREPVSGYCPGALLDTRGILGAAQREWLFEGLAAPGKAWNVIANQVGFAPLDRNALPDRRVYSLDNWDGYVADRQRVLDFLAANDLAQHRRDHGRRARELGPQRAAGLPQPRRHAGRDGVHGHVDLLRGIRPAAAQTAVRRRSEQPAPAARRLPPRLCRGDARPEDVWSGEFRVVEDVRTAGQVATPLATYVVHNGAPGGVRDGV